MDKRFSVKRRLNEHGYYYHYVYDAALKMVVSEPFMDRRTAQKYADIENARKFGAS